MNSIPDFTGPKPLHLGERLERGYSFASKLLLFGEYGLMFDAMALSVPFQRFSGQLAYDELGQDHESTAEIRKFFDHLQHIDFRENSDFIFDLEMMDNDLKKGLYFKSNIPQQYGVGSSGALVAALFENYGQVKNSAASDNIEILKSIFAQLEGFFHGKSSGLDPLISYLNKPILIDSKKQISQVEFDLNKSGLAIALIDTETTGATGPLVQHFIDLFNLLEFKQAFEKQFIPANNGCIESLLNGDKSGFFLNLEQLIRFEVYHFHRMIPAHFHRVISHAICSKVYIKLLGSGGGGFLLAFAESSDVFDQWSKKSGIELLPIV